MNDHPLSSSASTLNLEPHFHDPGQQHFRDFSPGDDFYEALIEAHHGLSERQSEALNARLILLLANHIGDVPVLRQALTRARANTLATVAPEPGVQAP